VSTTLHPERLAGVDPRLADLLVMTWNAELDFDRIVIEGVRTRATVAANWAKGREQLPDGTWHVVDPHQIVTHAQHPEDSPHCHAGALDCMPLVAGKVIWSDKDAEWVICLNRLQLMADIAKRLGITWGGNFTNLKDLDHFEVPDWRQLPMVAA